MPAKTRKQSSEIRGPHKRGGPSGFKRMQMQMQFEQTPLPLRPRFLEDDSPVLRYKLTPHQRIFLKAYVQCGGSISRAAHAIGISGIPHYQWLKKSKEYAQAFEGARPIAAQMLEDEAIRRSNEGWLEPVYQGGRLVGYKRMYSDGLMIRVLGAVMPEKYRDKVPGTSGSPLHVTVDFFDTLVQAERSRIPAIDDGGATIDISPVKPNGKANGKVNGSGRKK